MQIFVKSQSTTAVDIDEDTTVFDVKKRIAPNPRDVIMSFAGKALADSEPLVESGVRSGNTVYVTLRLRGGRGIVLEQDMQLGIFEAKFDQTWHQPTPNLAATAENAQYVDEVPEIDYSIRSMWQQVSASTFQPAPAFEEPNTWSQPEPVYMPPAMHPEPCFMSATIPTPEELISSGDDTDGEHFECGTKRSFECAMEQYEAVPQKRRAPAIPEQPASNPEQITCKPAVDPAPVQPHRRGAAYDLDTVDEKLRKRLLKNRRSAERSRQKKNAAMKESEQALQQSQAENVELQKELEEMRRRHEEVQKQHEAMRQLLLANNILPPF